MTFLGFHDTTTWMWEHIHPYKTKWKGTYSLELRAHRLVEIYVTIHVSPPPPLIIQAWGHIYFYLWSHNGRAWTSSSSFQCETHSRNSVWGHVHPPHHSNTNPFSKLGFTSLQISILNIGYRQYVRLAKFVLTPNSGWYNDKVLIIQYHIGIIHLK